MDNAQRAKQRLIAKGFALTDNAEWGAKSFASLMAFVGGGGLTPLRTDLGAAAAAHFASAGLTTSLRIAHVLAQQSVETRGFSAMVENLNYSVAGLKATFSRSRISAADCERLGRKASETAVPPDRQREIGNIVYGGSFGVSQLGNTQPGDGFKFRGRGAKQTTGRANYGRVADLTGLDLLDHPELLENADNGMRAACIFWKDKGCNAFADADDITGLTQRINGGQNGIDARKVALARVKSILL